MSIEKVIIYAAPVTLFILDAVAYNAYQNCESHEGFLHVLVFVLSAAGLASLGYAGRVFLSSVF